MSVFTTHCPDHDATVLIWTSQIDAIDNTPHGILVRFHCTCGYCGTWRPRRTATGESRAA